MVRKTFGDLLNNLKFCAATEFNTLWKMFYQPIYDQFSDQVCYALRVVQSKQSISNLCEDAFSLYPKEIRRTYRNLSEYNSALRIGKNFLPIKGGIKFDTYLLLCEYIATLAYGLSKSGVVSADDLDLLLKPLAEQISDSLDWCGHKLILRNFTWYAVPKDAGVIEAAKVVEPSLAEDIMYYGHRNMRGKVDEKRDILIRLCRHLEGVRNDVAQLSSSIASALFNMANQLDVRHNNTSESSPQYKPFVAALHQGQLEHWYDNLFKTCIAAIQLVNAKDAIKEYKDNQQIMNESCKTKKN